MPSGKQKKRQAVAGEAAAVVEDAASAVHVSGRARTLTCLNCDTSVCELGLRRAALNCDMLGSMRPSVSDTTPAVLSGVGGSWLHGHASFTCALIDLKPH
jgi:hypothetical protein